MGDKNRQVINIGNNNKGTIRVDGNMQVSAKLNPLKSRDANDSPNKHVKKILILAANPKTTPRLHLDEEVREIEEGLRRARHRERFEIQSRWAVRYDDLRRALLDIEPHIVHFIGHGKVEGLLVEDEMGFATLVSSKALTGLFELCKDHVKCVILSACHSAHQAVVIKKHIDYVIGMRQEIKGKAAIEFAVGFYDALGAGKNVEQAFKFGCNAVIQQFPDLPGYLIPVLK
jgi:CHAT domain-containing protein